MEDPAVRGRTRFSMNESLEDKSFCHLLARMFHEWPTATMDMAVLPGVLGCRPLRRTIQVRFGTNALRLPGDTPIFMVSLHQFTKYPGYKPTRQ
jgi:hypothetical protein